MITWFDGVKSEMLSAQHRACKLSERLMVYSTPYRKRYPTEHKIEKKYMQCSVDTTKIYYLDIR